MKTNQYFKLLKLPNLFSFIFTVVILSYLQFKITPPVILLERFFTGSGQIVAILLAFYAAWVTHHLVYKPQDHKFRRSIWTLFSVVFFTQLGFGLLGFEMFLMTGELHLPIPALIAAGPIYRGEGFFMPVLFLSTVILVGPAWCSYLCYIGAWDNQFAATKKKATPLPKWRHKIRLLILVSTLIVAYCLARFSIPVDIAILIALMFGLVGVGIMIKLSKKLGVMVHCVSYCPIGLIANWLGKINPFRIKIVDGCTTCQACSIVCRYDAINLEDIKKSKPNSSCTLCGDCVDICPKSSLVYTFPGLSNETARKAFVVIIATLHAVFMGVARI